MFHEFVAAGLRTHPEIEWLVFAGPTQPWAIEDRRVEVVREFAANDRRLARLAADHFAVGPAAKIRGAAALLTIGFVPRRSAGVPTIMHLFSLHHLSEAGGWRGAYRRWAVAQGLRQARLVIVNSRWTAQQVAVGYGSLQLMKKLLVSHEGLRHDVFRVEGARGRPDLPPSYLLWCANFYPYKRADLALRAYAALPPELRAHFPFILVGGNWEGGLTRARTVAHSLGIEPQVRFLGWVNDAELPALYRGARAHVLSTAEETFGRSVSEAMACGCPCVLQDLPVLREVTDGAALFTDFEDTRAAAAALRRICTDDSLVERLRAEGLRRASSFSFENLARERLDGIMRALIS